MTLATVSWALERRYGDPLLRAVMLALAMESGGEDEWETRLPRISAATEIDEAEVALLLDEAVHAGHLVEVRRRSTYSEYVTVRFPIEAFPELQRERNRPRTPAPPSCPPKLRRRVLAAFQLRCSYCGRRGDARGIGGQPWHIDRIKAGGPYAAENVTLACMPCNLGKGRRPAPPGTRSLADMEAASA